MVYQSPNVQIFRMPALKKLKFQADFGWLTKVEVSLWGSRSLAAAPIIILEQHCVAEFLGIPGQIQVHHWLLET